MPAILDASALAIQNRTLQKKLSRIERKLELVDTVRQQNANFMRTLMSERDDERAESERLLLNILPGPIAQRLENGSGVIADHAVALTQLALDMKAHFRTLAPVHGHHVDFRMGISSGPVVGGVIGTHKFHYDIWGDTVNTAARMESHGVPGRIHVSSATYELIKEEFVCEPRGPIDVKGNGTTDTWFVERSSDQ